MARSQEDDNVEKAKKWSKDVDKTDAAIDKANESGDSPDEKLRKLLEDD